MSTPDEHAPSPYELSCRREEWASRVETQVVLIDARSVTVVRRDGRRFGAEIAPMGDPGRPDSFDRALSAFAPDVKGRDHAVYVGGLLVMVFEARELKFFLSDAATVEVLRGGVDGDEGEEEDDGDDVADADRNDVLFREDLLADRLN